MTALPKARFRSVNAVRIRSEEINKQQRSGAQSDCEPIAAPQRFLMMKKTRNSMG